MGSRTKFETHGKIFIVELVRIFEVFTKTFGSKVMSVSMETGPTKVKPYDFFTLPPSLKSL